MTQCMHGYGNHCIIRPWCNKHQSCFRDTARLHYTNVENAQSDTALSPGEEYTTAGDTIKVWSNLYVKTSATDSKLLWIFPSNHATLKDIVEMERTLQAIWPGDGLNLVAEYAARVIEPFTTDDPQWYSAVRRREENMQMAQNTTPAFPYTASSGVTHIGMTLRDWFAGMAMQGAIATEPNCSAADIAAGAYQMADAMMRARS